MVGHRLQCREACRAVTAQPDRPLCPEVQVRSVRQTAGSGNGCPCRPPHRRRRRGQGPMRVVRKGKPEGSGRVPALHGTLPYPSEKPFTMRSQKWHSGKTSFTSHIQCILHVPYYQTLKSEQASTASSMSSGRLKKKSISVTDSTSSTERR